MSCVLQIPLSESWPLYPVTEELTMIIFYKKGGGGAGTSIPSLI